MTHWLLVSSPANFEITRARGFDVAAMKTRWKKAASEVGPGDTVFFYVTGQKAIAGEAVAVNKAYFDETYIWDSAKPGESYPWRFPTKLVKAREAGGFLPIEQFVGQYEYAKRWPAKNWPLAFQGNVHRLGQADYTLISSLL